MTPYWQIHDSLQRQYGPWASAKAKANRRAHLYPLLVFVGLCLVMGYMGWMFAGLVP